MLLASAFNNLTNSPHVPILGRFFHILRSRYQRARKCCVTNTNNNQQEEQQSGPYYYIDKQDEQANIAAEEQQPESRNYIDKQVEQVIISVDAAFWTKQPILFLLSCPLYEC